MGLREFQGNDEASVRAVLAREGWTDDQLQGQLDVTKHLAKSESGFVAVASDEGRFSGFISAQFYEWNRLTEIHGLAVDPDKKRQGLASRLVAEVEEFAHSKVARGVYVDTPVDNHSARAFYVANGYQEAYEMPRYYSDDLDGITFTKFFD